MAKKEKRGPAVEKFLGELVPNTDGYQPQNPASSSGPAPPSLPRGKSFAPSVRSQAPPLLVVRVESGLLADPLPVAFLTFEIHDLAELLELPKNLSFR